MSSKVVISIIVLVLVVMAALGYVMLSHNPNNNPVFNDHSNNAGDNLNPSSSQVVDNGVTSVNDSSLDAGLVDDSVPTSSVNDIESP